jgi:hypothetical protein
VDLISGFKSELFRPLVTLVVPGAVALAPHILVTGYYFPQVPLFWNEHPSAFVAIVVIAVIATGLILENIGGRIEAGWDRCLNRHGSGHIDKWTKYLRLKVESEFIGQRYLRTVLVRLKFELAMLPALVFFAGGLIWLQSLDSLFTPSRFMVVVAIIVVLLSYLVYESYKSAKTLGESRDSVLQGVEEEYERRKALAAQKREPRD